MKKIYLSLITGSIFLASCGGDAEVKTITGEATMDKVVEEEATEEKSAYSAGEVVYKKICVACHQVNGEGMTGVFPPLASSDYLLEDKIRAIEQVLNGSEGEIVVNGDPYNGVMPAQYLTDEEVRDVVNYALNSWGNEGGEVTIDDVANAKHPE